MICYMLDTFKIPASSFNPKLKGWLNDSLETTITQLLHMSDITICLNENLKLGHICSKDYVLTSTEYKHYMLINQRIHALQQTCKACEH